MALSNYLSDEEIANYVNQTTESDSDVEDIITDNMTGIFGLPYGFMDTVDRRLSGGEMGRKYAEKITARLPLLFLTPVEQKFMEGFSDDDKNSVLDYLGGMAASVSSGDVSELLEGQGLYYSTEYAYDDYYNYVNPACRAVAKFLGIQNTKVTIGGESKTLANFSWQNATNEAFKTFFSAQENLVFYLDGMTEVTESISNSTTESSLASTINGYSDTAREIQFLLGGTDSVVSSLVDSAGDAVDSALSSLSSVIGTFGGGLVSSLANSGITSVLAGGKIIFPEIWQDSSYERDYSLNIKLRSPDHDSLSIYLNILVPYIHLLCLCLPRGMSDDPNAYTSPFLVRAYCKGMFNVDMGMITSMSVTKGAECCWNDDGLPTQIDISLTIQDLYSSLFISDDSNIKNFIVNNESYLNYLANTAGLNLAQMPYSRRVSMYVYLMKSKYSTLDSRLWTRFSAGISKVLNKLYNAI